MVGLVLRCIGVMLDIFIYLEDVQKTKSLAPLHKMWNGIEWKQRSPMS